MIENKIFSTVSTALDFLVTKINEQVGIPVVHDPQSSHRDCVEEWRTQQKDRYSSQGIKFDENQVTPSLLGWDRSAARFQTSVGVGGQRNSVVSCACAEEDAEGNLTGNAIIWKGLRAEVPLRFRVYSTDVRDIERLEILFLSQMAISNIKEIDVFMNPAFLTDPSAEPLVSQLEPGVEVMCKTSQFQIDWDFGSPQITFNRDDNFVITYEFEAIIRGEFLFGTGVPETVTTDVQGNYGTSRSTFVLDLRYQAKLVADVNSPNQVSRS